MTENNYSVNSLAVQKHLEIVQGVIQRMAENSRSCKVWCVTLVSAVLVLVARTEKPEYALIALVPAILFLILDTYYLALEQAFRESYNTFVRKLHGCELEPGDVYSVVATDMGIRLVGRCLRSVSIWLFYPPVAIVIFLAWYLMSLSDLPLVGVSL